MNKSRLAQPLLHWLHTYIVTHIWKNTPSPKSGPEPEPFAFSLACQRYLSIARRHVQAEDTRWIIILFIGTKITHIDYMKEILVYGTKGPSSWWNTVETWETCIIRSANTTLWLSVAATWRFSLLVWNSIHRPSIPMFFTIFPHLIFLRQRRRLRYNYIRLRKL